MKNRRRNIKTTLENSIDTAKAKQQLSKSMKILIESTSNTARTQRDAGGHSIVGNPSLRTIIPLVLAQLDSGRKKLSNLH